MASDRDRTCPAWDTGDRVAGNASFRSDLLATDRRQIAPDQRHVQRSRAIHASRDRLFISDAWKPCPDYAARIVVKK
jgi:hypothetical protein